MEAATRFVIISYPRSGSNYLCGLLNSHPEILCHHEIFHRKMIYYAMDHRDDLNLGDIRSRNRDPLGFLSKIWGVSLGMDVVGFKIFPGQNMYVLERLLADRGVRKIVLTRPNLLRLYVSKKIAAQTKEFTLFDGTQEKIKPRVDFDRDEFRDFEANYQTFFRQVEFALQENETDYIWTTYPAILSQETTSEILEFLKVRVIPEKLHTPHKKQGIYKFEEIFKNYDENIAALARQYETESA